MRVSKYFKLGRDQSTLDFLDVHIDKDIPVFVDPTALRGIDTEWGQHCRSLLQNYFGTVMSAIQNGDHSEARRLLASLRERNEFHLGFSAKESRGRALGPSSAADIWAALSRSKAAQSGLLKDLEDTILFVDGVGPDMLSDAICNIIRGPLIDYTQQSCLYYGIPLTPGVDSGPIWNPKAGKWETANIELPLTKKGPLVLIPKSIVRTRPSFSHNEYVRYFLMRELESHEKSINSSLVHVLKGRKNKGEKRVYKKDLYEKYGADKLSSAKQTASHPAALTKYRAAKSVPTSPLNHTALAELGNGTPPNFAQLMSDVKAVHPGKAGATQYENAIEKLLSALFYPSLGFPTKQDEIHDGRKRIDITYVNSATEGFFRWLSTHYSASHIFVECKNYGREVGNPELDQISSRFSPSRGTVGLLVVRSLEDKTLLLRRCKDTATDSRGYVIVLDDEDLEILIGERSNLIYGNGDNLLYKRFKALIS